MVRKRILMVEDSAIVARIQQAQLDALHAEIHLAVNGEQALEMALSRPPDLMVVDLVMPSMDGFALCQALKADGRTAKVPLLVVTALSRDAKERSLLAGADDFMRKPPSTLLLQHRVSNLLEIGAAEEEGMSPRGLMPLKVASPQSLIQSQIINQCGDLVHGEALASLEGILPRMQNSAKGALALDAAFGLPQVKALVEAIREDAQLVETPILLLHTKDDLAALEHTGIAVDDFLEKPLEAGVTRHRIKLVTRLAAARRIH